MVKLSPVFSKLITMEITVGALLLGMRPHIRHLNRECHFLGLEHPLNRQNCLRYAVCKAMQVLLIEYCPSLLYLGHLVGHCNWAGENANTGVVASEGLHIIVCTLDHSNMGDTLFKYERTVATARLCHIALRRLKQVRFYTALFHKKHREMMWAFSVNYPVSLTLIFDACFFS